MNRELRKMKRSPDRAVQTELAVTLLQRSVKFGHPRLVHKRLLHALELGVVLPVDVVTYLRLGKAGA